MAAKGRKLTDEELVQVEALAAVLSSEQIADYFGIGRRTFYSIMERQPEVAARYKKGRAKAVEDVARGLLADARADNLTAKMFYLKTQAGWRETSRHEVTGANGKPIKAKFDVRNEGNIKIDLSSKTTEEIEAIRKGLEILKDVAIDEQEEEG